MSRTILLAGFLDQGNLGLGYLAATLDRAGYAAQTIDVRQEPEQILELARRQQPVLIGFSLIFQYYLPRFRRLAACLRAHGVRCHFTIGGHYPSLRPKEVLGEMPELDSVVRCEGEATLLDLTKRLASGCEWRETPGIAYRRNDQIVLTSARPLASDLDELPWPTRDYEPEHVLGRRYLPILGSRGCARRCSFCSIHTFYRSAPGKAVRCRRPAEVVREMKALHDDRGITIFLFQDDDFPLWGAPGRRWALALVDELDRRGLATRILWKISCRVEHVEPRLFARLREAGLYLVYLGLESGTDTGLQALNKDTSVAQNLEAVSILKKLDLMFQYGFMLFDPSSTFRSVRENAAFLRRIVGDGSVAAVFCRMLPYAGTPVEEQLVREGRLRGDISQPDYAFLDPRLDDYFAALLPAVAGWIGDGGVSCQLNWAWHEVAVIERAFPPVAGLEAYKAFLRALTRSSNDTLLSTVENSSRAWERGEGPALAEEGLASTCRELVARLRPRRDEFIADNQEVLLAALEAGAA